MNIRFSSSVLLVEDIDASRTFYEELLEQKVELDHGVCVVFIGGFSIWQKEHAHSIMKLENPKPGSNDQAYNFELYFESDDLESLLSRVLEKRIKLVHNMYEQPWGQRVFRMFDPDGYIVEIGEPMTVVIQRYLRTGMEPDAVATRTSMPIEIVMKEVEL